MGVAVAVGDGHVDMQVGVVFVIVADDAAGAGELDGTRQVKGLAVAVTRLGVQLHHVAEMGRIQRADSAEDDAVIDARAVAGLGQAQQHVRTGGEANCDDTAQLAFCHFDVHVFHSQPP